MEPSSRGLLPHGIILYLLLPTNLPMQILVLQSNGHLLDFMLCQSDL